MGSVGAAGSEGRSDTPLEEGSEALASLHSRVNSLAYARYGCGYCLIAFGLAVVPLVLMSSSVWLIVAAIYLPSSSLHEVYFSVALLAAHAVIGTASIVFLYSVIRSAERLVFPLWMDPDPRDLLGREVPQRAVLRWLKHLKDVGLQVGVPGGKIDD